MTMEFRMATATDLPVLHALVERAYRGGAAEAGWTHEAGLVAGHRTDVATLAAVLADPAQRIILAETGAELNGCVQLSDCGAGLCYMGMLAVEPGLQAAGLGRRIIAFAESQAQALFGATRIEMTVVRQRGPLIAYYERRGYALTGEERPFPYDESVGVPLRPDLAFVVLAKALAPAG